MPAVQPALAAAAATMQRRHSSASSSDTGSDHGLHSRHTSQENISLIPTRTTKVATSKPAANPLQFVKVGPCDLSRHAQEQIKKVEEVKKVKPEKRDEAEDWQSNLDNWKVSRRKRQEHIIERVVEVKKLELEEHDRNRRRSKTFNEMLEERNSKGRKTSLPVYQDDDNDLSELGLSTPKSNGDDSVFHDRKERTSSSDDVSSACSSGANGENGTTVNGHFQRDQRELSSEQEEYTYERAIQNYVNFTESRVRGRSLTPSDSDNSKFSNGLSKKSPPVPTKPRRGSCKIEEKLSEFEQIKKKSMSTNDLTGNSKRPLSVPKVDILKRREMFEKSQEEETPNTKNRPAGEFGSSKSIRDRVSSFGKPAEESPSVKSSNRMSPEISVKDRRSCIEKQNIADSTSSKSNIPNGSIATSHSVKDRLSSLGKTLPVEPKLSSQNKVTQDKPDDKKTTTVKTSVKENLSSSKPENSQISKPSNTSTASNNNNKENSAVNSAQKEQISGEESREKSILSPAEDLYETKRQQHYRHRSLDSLDIDSNDGVGNESFERVQSLEDLDFCRNYPASSVSGDTDREDSGIHTADASSSVSQADDCDLHLDGEFHQQPTIFEEINKNSDLASTLIVKQINQISVSDSEYEIPVDIVPGAEVGENSSSLLKLPIRLDCDPLPVILESPSEPIPPFSITDSSISVISLPEPSESSHNITSSQSNVTTNAESDSNSFNKSETVNTNFNLQSEQFNVPLTACGVETSAANSVHTIPISLSTLPVQLSSAEVLHDNKSGSIDISHKIELCDLGTPLPKPMVAVEAEYKFEPQEHKFEDSVEYKVEGVHHLSELTVDVSNKQDSKCLILSSDTMADLPVFSDIDTTKLIDGIDVVFPLSPSTMEPPKEKPPPPPTEISDDDESINNKSALRRLDSTKRIKKEIRQKRSSFLGIESSNNDNYLEPELELVRRPPDISSFLAEEKRLEQLLYRQSICSESESRDSGVELEKHHDDLTWPTVHHSRDNSEIYANTSTTSEEEEIVKKEREIIELLEREEINRYSSSNQDQDNIGEKLAERLRELEAEKSRLEWEREEETSRRKAEEAARAEQQNRIQARELELCKQENTQDVEELDKHTELLMAERERLEAEQESLARQRDVIIQQQYNRSLTDVRVSEPPVLNYRGSNDYRRSMQDLRASEPVMTCYQRPVEPLPSDNRRSMPDLAVQTRRPPPPIPPAKPLIIPRSQDKRMSSPQQMSRQTLQALSAAPRPRLNDNWLQTKRKNKPAQDNYNYQHWLIQEAEQRRITEHHQRQAPPPRRPVPPPPHQNGGWRGNNSSSGQYTNWQPPGGQWGAPSTMTTQSQPRQDKPLPDSIIQTLTQRVQNRLQTADPNNNRRRTDQNPMIEPRNQMAASDSQEKMLSVSGKKKCSHCGEELGRGAAMIIESLRLFYHIDCFKCCVCCVQLGDGLMGTDVRVRNNKLHCHNCYSSDDGVKFSCV